MGRLVYNRFPPRTDPGLPDGSTMMSDEGRMLDGRVLDDRAPGRRRRANGDLPVVHGGARARHLGDNRVVRRIADEFAVESGVPVRLVVLAFTDRRPSRLLSASRQRARSHKQYPGACFQPARCFPRHHRIVLVHRQSPRQHDANAYAMNAERSSFHTNWTGFALLALGLSLLSERTTRRC